ncbi:hypothetical protein SZ63_03110 [Methanoculleus sediminis]|uniref:Phosphate-starvation-inducible E-like protein n=1 Tax=Methanoculleus sediminis TaxID=1550566 RepID=A0A0H1QYR5_9EURY|nr:phosphate-starvation-inducible PsiE family protein [Methanoculleus sediminis]KLK88073.1 hypothetical protein SZ63_03110 [Methanoculleus sediminis]
MRRFVERFEHFTYIVLIIFLIVLLFFTLVELGWVVFTGLFEESVYRLDSDELFDLLGYFLLVLIGLELLETIKAYLDRGEFHVEVILLVAIIAIARKVILLNTSTAGELIGIALVVIALSGGYYLIRLAGRSRSFLSGRREEP